MKEELTPEEWFKRVGDKELRDKLLFNLEHYPIKRHIGKKFPSLQAALRNGFTWSSTGQGHVYWGHKTHQFRNNPQDFLEKGPILHIQEQYSI